MNRKLPLALAISAASIMLNSQQVISSGLALEEVVVTARKKQESLIDVPMSISAIGGDDIAKMNFTDVESLQDALPNLSIVSASLATQRAYIRGQGSDNNRGFEQSVGWFVDGIYGGKGEQFKAPMFDVASVELLRGPQGTVLGKNIIAGAINIRTARPTADFEGKLSALFTDETGEQKYEAVVSGPLSDNVRGRLALMDRSTDGWIENIATAAPDFGEKMEQRDDDVVRVSLEWDITENLDAFIKFETASAEVQGLSNQIHINADSAALAGIIAAQDDVALSDKSPVLIPCGDEALRAGPFAGSCGLRGNTTTFDVVESDNVVVELNYDLNGYEITALSGWSEFDSERLSDADYSHLTTLDNWQRQSFEQFSQEIRIASPGGELIDWTAGLYYQDNDYVDQTNNLINLLASFGTAFDLNRQFEQSSETYSAFGEATYNFSDNMRFILGARWTDEEKVFDKSYGMLNPLTGELLNIGANPADALPIGVATALLGGAWAATAPNVIDNVVYTSGDRNEKETTLAGTFQYDMGDHQIYFNIAEGYKAGGFDASGSGLETFQFEPENALAYELGGKFLLADGAANLNVAIFHVQYEDLQVSVFDGISFQVKNAAQSTSQGIEVDGKWRLTESVTVGGAAAYLDSTFDSYSGAACTENQEDVWTGAVDCTQDLAGEDTNFAPRFSGNLNLEYSAPMGDNLLFSARVDVSYRDEIFTEGDNDPIDRLDSYTKWDARLGISSADDTWEVALLGKNLTDESYALFSGDTPLVGGSHGGAAGLPRTISLQGSYNF